MHSPFAAPGGAHHPLHWRDTPRRRRWRLWGPVVVAALVQIPGGSIPLVRAAVLEARGLGDGPTWAQAAVLGLAIVGVLSLIGARRFPGPVVALATAAATADLLIDLDGRPPYLALSFAIVSAVVRGARVWAWTSVAVGWLATILLTTFVRGVQLNPFLIGATTVGVLLVFGVGEAMRGRAERAAEFVRLEEQRREEEIRAERLRIARELHDVLAHSLSQITVQAGVGLHLMEKRPEQAAEALQSIRDTSKTALDDVRAVLGMLRQDGEGAEGAPRTPEPDLARVPALILDARSRGLDVDLDDGLGSAGPLAGTSQLALYRIVQESLTNISRHSDARHATVRLWREGDSAHVEVRDTGSPVPSGEPSGGRGLRGMRERAELLGGEFEAGASPSGGFRVHARIPVSVDPAEAARALTGDPRRTEPQHSEAPPTPTATEKETP